MAFVRFLSDVKQSSSGIVSVALEILNELSEWICIAYIEMKKFLYQFAFIYF